MDRSPRIVIVRNPSKPAAEATLASLVAAIDQHATVIATGTIDATEGMACEKPDRIIVLGGDGSILAVVRALGPEQVPIVGVNFGKLGYLAEFSVDDVRAHLQAVLDDETIISRRMMLEVSVVRGGSEVGHGWAVNDCVVHAGPPYRMVDLVISVNGDHLTMVSGDGLVLATPCGSTAHNMALGGPIMQSGIHAIIITPIAPHSLTHRPLVVEGGSVVEVLAGQVNEGTTAVIDGQVSLPLEAGDQLIVRRYAHDFSLVHNPAQPRWYTLTKKLKWGQ